MEKWLEEVLEKAKEQKVETDEREVLEVFRLLDKVRDSGIINMFEATPILVATYRISKEKAKFLLVNWMSTFNQRHSR